MKKLTLNEPANIPGISFENHGSLKSRPCELWFQLEVVLDHFEHVINTLDVGYNAISDDDQLTVMWAATEADIKDVVTKGLVPGSYIGSSGMFMYCRIEFNVTFFG